MKSSYKLFGIFWDHKASVDLNGSVVIPFENGIDYRYPYCLYDLVGEYRTIRISEMLSIDSEGEWESVCNRLRDYSHISLVIDYITDISSYAASLFYKRKLCQIYNSLQNLMPNARVVIQIPTVNAVAWNDLQTRVS